MSLTRDATMSWTRDATMQPARSPRIGALSQAIGVTRSPDWHLAYPNSCLVRTAQPSLWATSTPLSIVTETWVPPRALLCDEGP